jgi:hypothetical protein
VLIEPGEVHVCNPQNGFALIYYRLYLAPELIQNFALEITGRDNGTVGFNAIAPQAGRKHVFLSRLHHLQSRLSIIEGGEVSEWQPW